SLKTAVPGVHAAGSLAPRPGSCHCRRLGPIESPALVTALNGSITLTCARRPPAPRPRWSTPCSPGRATRTGSSQPPLPAARPPASGHLGDLLAIGGTVV